jgi:3-deoxy-manno-octulosonate cytidylyltransferase (CMP-KDO synthetase)
VFRVVIPARFGSTRLPGKPLKELRGKPMLQWVHAAAMASGASEVIVATDDERVLAAARDFGASARMTSLTHQSGTDRIAEVALQSGWDENEVVVDLQGDYPMVPAELVGQVASLLLRHPGAAMATLATRITSESQFLDPATVKVVTDSDGRALYFSRAPIPWDRDSAPATLVSQRSFTGARRHVGLYAYRVKTLRRLSMLPPSPLEQIEKLEQLRALENGLEIRVTDARADPGPAVDTPEDLARVTTLMERAGAPLP